jgi:two-component sensor histidine kinase
MLRAAQLDRPGNEERFDRFARLARSMLGVPMAFVSVVTEKEVLFKGRAGSDLCSSDRNVSLCSHAIETPDSMMEIIDASLDPRFASNPQVTGDFHLRYYAGAPIICKGQTLGILCVIDTKARAAMTPDERAILQDLADALALAMISHQERQDLTVIARELRHRMGNVYALISSLVTLLARNTETKEELASRLRERIVSLGETQKLLIGEDKHGGMIVRLAEQVLAPLRVAKGPKRIHIQAEDNFAIAPRAAFLLTLMLGELATNSVKHGALSVEGGQVHFTWHADPNDRSKLVLEWAEDCGADHNGDDSIAVFAKRRNGFGSQILLRILPADVHGHADMTLTQKGLVYRLTGLASRLVDSVEEPEFLDELDVGL